MTDDQLLRYSRHILLDEIGVEGQQRLLDAHALVVGAGGLGSPVVLYLGTAGVGRITVVDHDAVDLTNLQRQIAHNLERVGRPKAESARATTGFTSTSGLIASMPCCADSAFGCPTRAMLCAICRCRLVRSTLSWSTSVMRPTPAVPR